MHAGIWRSTHEPSSFASIVLTSIHDLSSDDQVAFSTFPPAARQHALRAPRLLAGFRLPRAVNAAREAAQAAAVH